jgi:hypothetical protein
VSEVIVYEDASGQWENLSLVLKTSERSRENQSVIVALELCSVIVAFRVTMFLSEALI